MWVLTYSIKGHRHVEVVPHTEVPKLEPWVRQYREYLDALRELGAINAQLLHQFQTS